MLIKHTIKSIFPPAEPKASVHFGTTVQMSHPNWRVRLQRDYKELPRNYLSQATGPNLATGSFQEQTCKERENIKATLWKWKQVFGIILEMFFWVYTSKGFTSDKQCWFCFFNRKGLFGCTSLHLDTYRTSCWGRSLWSHWSTTGDRGGEMQSSSAEDYWMGMEDFWSCHCHSALQEREKHLHL